MPNTILYLLEEQSTNQYDPKNVVKIWGIFSSVENAQNVITEYLRFTLKAPINWQEDQRGFMGDGQYVVSGDAYLIVRSEPIVKHLHIVPMPLDFDVPAAEPTEPACQHCGEVLTLTCPNCS